MADYGTIKLPREDYERHNERRKDLGVTWAEYIDGEAPDMVGNLEPFGGEVPEMNADVDYDHIREIVREETRNAIAEARQR